MYLGALAGIGWLLHRLAGVAVLRGRVVGPAAGLQAGWSSILRRRALAAVASPAATAAPEARLLVGWRPRRAAPAVAGWRLYLRAQARLRHHFRHG